VWCKRGWKEIVWINWNKEKMRRVSGWEAKLVDMLTLLCAGLTCDRWTVARPRWQSESKLLIGLRLEAMEYVD